ncbi:hypothetical protein M011DRAFT_474441 [Sporormia fimetaria CBS 119925]|uniref:Uncharacterized protein n=1 Tax=Sporormia fimetaria CBS 119925 TaxID=1340428 RepID=A0A6A6VN26_9PLEO|nr:hypothetical protein M011DRAFT_474441 [Sporormia fimetaria CBS 119925]
MCVAYQALQAEGDLREHKNLLQLQSLQEQNKRLADRLKDSEAELEESRARAKDSEDRYSQLRANANDTEKRLSEELAKRKLALQNRQATIHTLQREIDDLEKAAETFLSNRRSKRPRLEKHELQSPGKPAKTSEQNCEVTSILTPVRKTRTVMESITHSPFGPASNKDPLLTPAVVNHITPAVEQRPIMPNLSATASYSNRTLSASYSSSPPHQRAGISTVDVTRASESPLTAGPIATGSHRNDSSQPNHAHGLNGNNFSSGRASPANNQSTPLSVPGDLCAAREGDIPRNITSIPQLTISGAHPRPFTPGVPKIPFPQSFLVLIDGYDEYKPFSSFPLGNAEKFQKIFAAAAGSNAIHQRKFSYMCENVSRCEEN